MILFCLGVIALLVGICLAIAAISSRYNKNELSVGGTAFIIIGLILAISSCVSVVPTGYTGIKATFGAVSDEVLSNGLNLHAPWVSIITISNKEQTTTSNGSAFSKDLQEVSFTYTAKYSLTAAAAPEVYRTVGENYSNVLITPQINNAIKTEFGARQAEQMTSVRTEIQDNINKAVAAYVAPYGITVQVFIDDFDFTDAYTDAIEAKQVAEQTALKDATEQTMQTERTRQEAERAKIQAENEAAIAEINATAAANAAQIEAAANLEVAKMEADAIAYRGKKEAEALAAKDEVISETLIDYEYAQNWDGKLPSTIVGATDLLPILNIEGE